jgi:hypothetical protein
VVFAGINTLTFNGAGRTALAGHHAEDGHGGVSGFTDTGPLAFESVYTDGPQEILPVDTNVTVPLPVTLPLFLVGLVVLYGLGRAARGEETRSKS